MKGKLVLLTGGSTGIGKETAIGLARLGATVIFVSRNPERGYAALKDIREKSGSLDIHFMPCDLSSLAAVREFAQNFQKQFDKIDVLINNAGILPGRHQLTPEGFEVCWATNHLSGFLLTNLLWQQLLNAPAARIINISSEAHRLGQIDLNKLHLAKHYSAFTAYCDSKLANIIFTYELSRRLELTNITANCLHPGVIASSFGGTSSGLLKYLFLLGRPFMKNSRQGAETTIYLASAAEVEGVTGKYFKNKKEVKTTKDSYNPQLGRRLWQVSEEQTKLLTHL